MSLKAKVESVLFMSDKPLRAQAVATILGEELQSVRQALLELIHDYESRAGGLEIADEDGYSFRVKEEYASLMNEFLPVEISAAELRTLSAIAIKQPIAQSEIIRVRGQGAYEHVRELVVKDLVSRKEEAGGRSPLLATTKKFQEYFRLSKDGKSLRQYLKRQMKKKDKEDSENQTEQLELFPQDAAGDAAAALTAQSIPGQLSGDAAAGAVFDLKALITGLPAEVGPNLLTGDEVLADNQNFAPPDEARAGSHDSTTQTELKSDMSVQTAITPPDLSELRRTEVPEAGSGALNETNI